MFLHVDIVYLRWSTARENESESETKKGVSEFLEVKVFTASRKTILQGTLEGGRHWITENRSPFFFYFHVKATMAVEKKALPPS